MFFVGVQLDVTAPPTPKAIADLQAAPAGNVAASGDPAEAASANAGAEQQTGMLRSPAASQQVQSQVFALYQYQHSSMPSYACLPWYTCLLQFRQIVKHVSEMTIIIARAFALIHQMRSWYAAQPLTQSSEPPDVVTIALHAKQTFLMRCR